MSRVSDAGAFDLAVEAETQYERDFSMELMKKHDALARKYVALQAESEEIGQYNIRLREALAGLVHRCEAEDCGTAWDILKVARAVLKPEEVTQ